jgi:hypothetical protein
MRNVAFLALFVASFATAKPIATADQEGIRLVLTDEPCTLTAVKNLPFRATWVEKDKSYEGCYGSHPGAGIVMAYFDDKTVAIMPAQIFHKTTDI